MTPTLLTAAQDLLDFHDGPPAEKSPDRYARRMARLRAAVEAETSNSRQRAAEAPSAPEETA